MTIEPDISWETNELIDMIYSDEGSYRYMWSIIRRARTMQDAADELREAFGDMESCGVKIGQLANYIDVVKNETTPEDWGIDPWGDAEDDDEDDEEN